MNDERHNNLERFDRAVESAIECVPIPEGLSERILTELPLERRARVRRRTMLSYGVAAATVMAVMAASLVYFWPRFAAPAMDYESLLAQFGDAHRQFDPSVGQPLSVMERTTADRYFCPSDIITDTVSRWWAARGMVGRNGVVYELTNRVGVRATLYVLDLNSSSRPIAIGTLTASPPAGNSTLGRTAGAWTDGTRLFVLLVDGDTQQYRRFLRPKHGMV
jgi:hypothetical protein